MKREYRKWFSPALGRDMELLVFGHGGQLAIVFPTSCGRFYDFEDQGMVDAVGEKIEQGHLQMICVDSVDAESWYNRSVQPRQRIARHLQYEQYLMKEVAGMVHEGSGMPNLAAVGCSFGGYHAVNIALRHPDSFSCFLAMGGAFDPAHFLSGYYDEDCYFNFPLHYVPNLSDAWYLERYRRNRFVLAAGVGDGCRRENESMAQVLRDKGVPVRFNVWGGGAGHDWPSWQRMIGAYL